MTTKISKPLFECKYCRKGYQRESTLAAHLCEPKRRAQQEKEKGVQLGFRAYLRFFEMTQGNAKNKTYEEFCGSPYYLAFVKFGRHIHEIRAINPHAYIEWMLKQNKKLDYWCKDAFYEEYLYEHLRNENPQDAVERALKEMQRWADSKNAQFNRYFDFAAPNVICRDIVNGRISPWVVYNCNTGIGFLSKLNEEQLQIVFKYIDPDYWDKKIATSDDTVWIKDVLKQANL